MAERSWSPSSLAQVAVSGLRERALREPPSASHHFTLVDGFNTLIATDALLTENGWHSVGRKLGLTDQTMWRKLGLRGPLWSFVYEQSVHYAGDAIAEFRLDTCVQPRVELELIFGLHESPKRSSRADVLISIAWVALGFEIVDCHFPGWSFTPADALSDLLFHAGLYVGALRYFDSADAVATWTEALPARAAVRAGGEELAQGETTLVMGDPLTALSALTSLIAEQGGPPLRRGEIVATGTSVVPFAPRRGVDLIGSVDRLGLAPVRVSVR